MNQTINQIIQTAIAVQAPLLPAPIDTSHGDATPLFGAGGTLDSLGLVTLILNIEEMVEMQMGVAITIVSEKAMSAYRSPFATIGSLTEFIASLIQEKQHA
jgi:acyl carrier protein